jgi:hypothetical protein
MDKKNNANLNAINYKTHFKGPSLTKQSYKKQCDIQHIMRGYKSTGVFSHLNKNAKNLTFGEVNINKSWHETQNLLASLRSKFETMPDTIKLKFKTSKNMIDFISDPKNLKESVKLGLLSDEYLPSEPKPEYTLVKLVEDKKDEKKPEVIQAAAPTT